MSNENENKIQEMMQERGCIAPHVTPQAIDGLIVGATYTIMPSGKCMVCELTLANGFTVRGESSTVSHANFREDIGKKISFERAREKIWMLEGYLLQQRIHDAGVKAEPAP